MLKRIQEPEVWEPQINQAAFEALDMAIEALSQESSEDVISRQAAIDELDKGAWGVEWDKTLAKAMIESLPSAQPEAVEEAKNAVLSVIKSEPHWTPCSEELPKENGHYLVTFHQTATEEDLGFDMDDTDVRKMCYDTKHGWRTPRRIPSWINDAVVSTVLAWMPLPEPYKAIDAMRSLPSAQPEVKEIGYAECANAMLKMWIDNVLTDGEYNRIMDRLNAHHNAGMRQAESEVQKNVD